MADSRQTIAADTAASTGQHPGYPRNPWFNFGMVSKTISLHGKLIRLRN